MLRRRWQALLFAGCCLSLGTHAQESLEGEWMLKLSGTGPTIVGMLSLQQINGHWVGHVEGGPIGVEIDADRVEFTVDSRDLQGFVFNRVISGNVDEGGMRGTFVSTAQHTANNPAATGPQCAGNPVIHRSRRRLLISAARGSQRRVSIFANTAWT